MLPCVDLDEMTSYRPSWAQAHHRTLPGVATSAGPDTTLVEADYWIVPSPEFNKARAFRLDLLIAFGVSLTDYRACIGYFVSDSG